MIELLEYITPEGKTPFKDWFKKLDNRAKAHITLALTKVELGNFSNTKGVGSGVHECKIHFGPGYRAYFGKDGEKIVILLHGGSKKKQQKDIETAQELWKEYKKRKKSGETPRTKSWH